METELLLKRVSLGDTFAIKDLYDKYEKFMFKATSYFKIGLDDKQHAVDLGFSLVLLKEPINKLDEETFKKYLFTRCKHSAIKILKYYCTDKEKLRNSNTLSYNSHDNFEDSEWIKKLPSLYSLDQEVLIREKLRNVDKILNQYGHKLAIKCFRLNVIENYTVQESASKLNVSIHTVNKYTSDVRKYLKRRKIEI